MRRWLLLTTILLGLGTAGWRCGGAQTQEDVDEAQEEVDESQEDADDEADEANDRAEEADEAAEEAHGD